MTLVPVGGLRARLIHDSLYLAVQDIMGRLGWLDAVDGRAAVTIIPKPHNWDEAIEFNTLAMGTGTVPNSEAQELGSNLAKHTLTFFLDFFAENESVGTHLTGDLRDALEGKMSAIGRSTPYVEVYDLSLATPPVLFTVEVTSVQTDPIPPQASRPWARNLHVITVELEDYYGGDVE